LSARVNEWTSYSKAALDAVAVFAATIDATVDDDG
jgi:hypothetical protein